MSARFLASVSETPDLAAVFGEMLSEVGGGHFAMYYGFVPTDNRQQDVELSLRTILESAPLWGAHPETTKIYENTMKNV